jgi:hypothetical protein
VIRGQSPLPCWTLPPAPITRLGHVSKPVTCGYGERGGKSADGRTRMTPGQTFLSEIVCKGREARRDCQQSTMLVSLGLTRLASPLLTPKSA